MAQMNLFREALFECNLHEIAYPDKTHTLWNKRGDGEVFERLDRFNGDSFRQEAFPMRKHWLWIILDQTTDRCCACLKDMVKR